MDKTDRLLKQFKNQEVARVTPIASEMIMPNLSGDHSAGILLKTPTKDEDLVNKAYCDSHYVERLATTYDFKDVGQGGTLTAPKDLVLTI